MTIAVRPIATADRRFVISSWVASTRHLRRSIVIQDADWWTLMFPQVEKAIDRPGVHTLVAYETDDTDHVADLYGFITADTSESPPLVYFVYVKEAYRRAGIASRLFAAVGVNPSARFDYVVRVPLLSALSEKIPLAKHNPEPAIYPKRRTA